MPGAVEMASGSARDRPQDQSGLSGVGGAGRLEAGLHAATSKSRCSPNAPMSEGRLKIGGGGARLPLAERVYRIYDAAAGARGGSAWPDRRSASPFAERQAAVIAALSLELQRVLGAENRRRSCELLRLARRRLRDGRSLGPDDAKALKSPGRRAGTGDPDRAFRLRERDRHAGRTGRAPEADTQRLLLRLAARHVEPLPAATCRPAPRSRPRAGTARPA